MFLKQRLWSMISSLLIISCLPTYVNESFLCSLKNHVRNHHCVTSMPSNFLAKINHSKILRALERKLKNDAVTHRGLKLEGGRRKTGHFTT